MITHGYKSTGFKSSREMAQRLRNVAEFLEDHDNFKLESGAYLSGYDGKFSIHFDSKEAFVNAVKAVGEGVKEYTSEPYSKLNYSAAWAPIELSIPRDKVCRKIVKFECDPLFTAEEVEAL